MPEPSVILEELGRISMNLTPLAILWHVVFGITVILLLAGWRPSRRLATVGLALPILSVGAVAFVYGNPFNGVVFVLAAIILAAVAVGMRGMKVRGGPVWSQALGAGMVLFGWVYPHFLAGAPWWKCLYASPVGLVPCPTLSIVTGFALLAGGFGNRTWALVIAVMGLFYGPFGAFRLGVGIDFVLLLGAIALVVVSVCRPCESAAAIPPAAGPGGTP